MNDPAGDRFKAIEKLWKRTVLPDCFMVLRIDGRAFHTWTRGLEKPYDTNLMGAMDHVGIVLATEVSGVLCAYVQSDEISVITTDLASPGTEHWFGGVVQKVASVSASIATIAFNSHAWVQQLEAPHPALFDARVFALETVEEVADYLRWRQDDCRRNAVSMLAHHYIGKKAVHGMGTRARVEALAERGIVVDDQDRRFINGALIRPIQYEDTATFVHKKTNESETVTFMRTFWKPEPADFVRNWFYNTHKNLLDQAS
jgi:tRNA(His) 5'-end guanylyltransferase